jgi:hypothetical protein
MTVIALKKKGMYGSDYVQDTVEESSIFGSAGAITPVKIQNLFKV